MCIRQNVLVTHIGNTETNTCLTRVNRQDSCVLGSHTSTEELAGIVRIHQEWAFYVIEIFNLQIVGLSTPA